MEGAQKATSKQFFKKFNHTMRGKIPGGNTDRSFSCKWQDIETAFKEAVGEEHVIPLYSTFFKEDISPYGGKPMKIVLDDIEL